MTTNDRSVILLAAKWRRLQAVMCDIICSGRCPYDSSVCCSIGVLHELHIRVTSSFSGSYHFTRLFMRGISIRMSEMNIFSQQFKGLGGPPACDSVI
jgi:hypothetical protein